MMKPIILAVSLLALSTATVASEKATRLVDEMIEAHGGSGNWRNAETVYFEDQWTYPGGQKGPVGRTTVDQRGDVPTSTIRTWTRPSSGTARKRGAPTGRCPSRRDSWRRSTTISSICRGW